MVSKEVDSKANLWSFQILWCLGAFGWGLFVWGDSRSVGSSRCVPRGALRRIATDPCLVTCFGVSWNALELLCFGVLLDELAVSLGGSGCAPNLSASVVISIVWSGYHSSMFLGWCCWSCTLI